MSAQAELVSLVNDIRLNYGRGRGTLEEVSNRVLEIAGRAMSDIAARPAQYQEKLVSPIGLIHQHLGQDSITVNLAGNRTECAECGKVVEMVLIERRLKSYTITVTEIE